MRRTVWGMLAALLLLATACSVTTKDPSYVPPAPLPPLEQLEKAPLADPKDFSAGGGDVLAFITADHSVACSLTSARGEHVNVPYEQNRYSDAANNKLPTVPVAHCELGRYPAPRPADVKDDCAGTNLGYLGGVALLAPDNVRYGECRSGVTSMEAAFGPKGSKSGPMAELHVLADGQNIERNGLRCSAYNGGVACGNVSAGVGFFVSSERYELVPGPGKDSSKAPAEAPKTA